MEGVRSAATAPSRDPTSLAICVSKKIGCFVTVIPAWNRKKVRASYLRVVVVDIRGHMIGHFFQKAGVVDTQLAESVGCVGYLLIDILSYKSHKGNVYRRS